MLLARRKLRCGLPSFFAASLAAFGMVLLPSFTSLDDDQLKPHQVQRNAMNSGDPMLNASIHNAPDDTQKNGASLEDAVKAAEKAMQALKLATDPAEKTRLSTHVKQLLAHAEKIKSQRDAQSMATKTATHASSKSPNSTAAPRKTPKEPSSTRLLSKGEQILLLKSSFLHGFKFPPWTTPPEPSEFALRDGEESFLDTKELPIAQFQEDFFNGWKRADEALPPKSWLRPDQINPAATVQASRPVDLIQDAATDCSVVASMCAGTARVGHGHAPLLGSVLYPCNADTGNFTRSQNGKYILKLNFNGCFRKVVIDDRLPTSSTSRTIHIVDKNNPGLIWPPLVEKAYLKVRGGYDFPGSNSGTDLWILTGWIPEQLFLQSDGFEPVRCFDRIFRAFAYGDVFVTMGTGKMSAQAERELGLAGEHDYAVLDLREVDGQRLMLIKNPWCEGTSWRGKVKPSGSADEMDSNSDAEPVQNPRDLLNADAHLSPGAFWMDVDNVLQHFESIYLNWNPCLFTYRQDVHFAWDLSPAEDGTKFPRGSFASLSRHPQYTVSTVKGDTVWVLLWRHFQNAVPADATAEEIENDRYGIELKGHISLFAFSSGGHRVSLPDRAVEKGWYVDSPQTLLKLKCQPGQEFTLVPGEHELPAVKQTFTLSVFANSPITLSSARTKYPAATTVTGSWTKDTAGGNAHSMSYFSNPQYSITVAAKTSISLILETADTELNVHVKLLHSKGQRVYSIRNRDIVCDSKDYRRGCCLAECPELEPGQYTIICSTFEPNQLGDFSLMVESLHPTRISQLPREGAGRVRMTLRDVAFQPGQNTVAAPLACRRLAKMYALARDTSEQASSHAVGAQHSPILHRSLIRLSVVVGREPNQRILVASNDGEYSGCAGGVRTGDIDLVPNLKQAIETWIVLERLPASSEELEEVFSIELFVDQVDAVSCGQWDVWDD